KPSQPEIAHIVTSPLRDITLTFDRGPFNPIFNDSYTVTMTDPWSLRERNVILCKGNHSPDSKLCEKGSSICVCKYSPTTTRLKNIPNHNVTFTVSVSRAKLYNVEGTLLVNLMQHIRPQPVNLDPIEEDSPHQVKSKFCLKRGTVQVTGFLREKGKPLQCRIQVNKTEGILEIIRMVVWPQQVRSCIQVTFPNLTAFTTYTLSVAAVAGDEASDPVVSTFITAKTIPLQPPVLSNHIFLRYSSGQDSVLLVLWQALPHEVRGGAKVTYDLELFSDNGLELTRSNLTETSLVTTDPLPHGSLSLKLRARNELGQSQNFSSLNIPAFSEITPVPFVVNFARNKIHLHFQKPLPRSQFRQMVAHLCTTYSRYGEIDLCTEYPQTVPLTVNSSSGVETLYQYTPNRNDVSFSQMSVIYDLLDSSEFSPKNGTAMADVRRYITSTPQWISEERFFTLEEDDIVDRNDGEFDMADMSGDKFMLDNDDEEEDGKKKEDDTDLYDSGKEEKNKVKRSALLSSNLRQVTLERRWPKWESRGLGQAKDAPIYSQLAQNGRHLLSLPQPDSSTEGNDGGTSTDAAPGSEWPRSIGTSSDSELYRVFVSGQAESGLWGGMTPAQCYFTETSDEVDLTLSLVSKKKESSHVSADSEETGLILRWRQVCENKPKQFLVDTYLVYVSQDEYCQKTSFVGKVENPIFEPSFLSLPKGWLFACVAAQRRPSASHPAGFISQPKVKSLSQIKADSKDTVSPLVSLVVLVIPAVIVGILIWCYCKRRKSVLKRAEQVSVLLNEENDTNSKMEAVKIPVPATYGSSQKPNDGSYKLDQSRQNIATDSGVDIPCQNKSDDSTVSKSDGSMSSSSGNSESLQTSNTTAASSRQEDQDRHCETKVDIWASDLLSCDKIPGLSITSMRGKVKSNGDDSAPIDGEAWVEEGHDSTFEMRDLSATESGECQVWPHGNDCRAVSGENWIDKSTRT
ncbi:hypothetical protein PoB_004471100, partial [Plakobranchus ocellatus]